MHFRWVSMEYPGSRPLHLESHHQANALYSCVFEIVFGVRPNIH